MLKYGFFDSLDGDRQYTSSDIAFLNSLLMTNGVYASPADGFKVYAGTNMNVKIKPGTAVISGRYCINDSDYTATVAYSGGTYTRYTRIILRLNLTTRLFEFAASTFDGSPPALTRNDTIFELSLATIAVPVGTTTVTNAMITDDRGDNTICGFVTGAIDQIDTTDLFAQYAAEWDLLKTQYRTVAEDPTVLENYALKANVFEAGTSYGTTLMTTNVAGINKSGWYYAAGNVVGVAPMNNYYWLIQHIQGIDAQTAVQVAYAKTNAEPIVYTRSRYNGTWTSWYKTSALIKATTLYNGSVTANTAFNLASLLSYYTEITIKATSNTSYVAYMRVPVAALLANGYLLFDDYANTTAAGLLNYANTSTYTTLKSTVALTNLTIEGWL